MDSVAYPGRPIQADSVNDPEPVTEVAGVVKDAARAITGPAA